MLHKSRSELPSERTATLSWAPSYALRTAFSRGYGAADFRADLLAGVIVGIIALPLSIALAIASGVPPQHGLYTAIVAGALIALLGGSKYQISGPTAAFVVILAPISHQYGVGGLLMATLIAGLILVAMAVSGMGRMIEFIPYTVTTGFTAGIAIVIATLQVKDFFGLTIEHLPEKYVHRVIALAQAAPTAHVADFLVGALTLSLLIWLPKFSRKIPAPIIALPAAAVIAWLAHSFFNIDLATIQSRYNGIPQAPPTFKPPWSWSGPDGAGLDPSVLIGPAFAIAMLGAIESLLSAVVADGMTGKRHNPDAELFAQGVGNVVAPFFGGFAATGAIARTATSIRSGARSPIAAIVHSLFVLLTMVLLAPMLGYLPMAALAAQLLITAWNMSEIKHVIRMLRVAARSDVFVLLTCLSLTVLFDMVISVSVGVVLAALLFMRRMADLATVKLLGEGHPELEEQLPKGVMVYDIGGPLFFGAAQRAVSSLRAISGDIKVVLLDMRDVPIMDATGLVNLESALDTLHRAKVFVVVAGVQEQPLLRMARAGWKHRPWLVIYRSFEDGLALARSLAPSDFEHTSGEIGDVTAEMETAK